MYHHQYTQRFVFKDLLTVASAPAVWQRAMDKELQCISGFHCMIDEIIITSSSTNKHLSNLEKVLNRLPSFNFENEHQERLHALQILKSEKI